MPFIGRKHELALLKETYDSDRSELLVIYGRRRVGKSRLISEFLRDKKYKLSFEGLEGESTAGQVRHLASEFNRQRMDSILPQIQLKNWEDFFNYLTQFVFKEKRKSGRKYILFLDEIQWLAAGRSKLISLIKFYWDKYWKEQDVLLILCGSVASFMIQKVLRSKALYGRLTCEVCLPTLSPKESYSFLRGNCSSEDALKYLLIFGGVPKYLEDIQLNKSFSANINDMCFTANSIMLKEIDRIFYSQFRETDIYHRIIELLNKQQLTFKDISVKLNMSSGGGLKRYLVNLKNAGMIKDFISYDKKENSKYLKYGLSDEFLIFFFKYMQPNLRYIQAGGVKLFEKLSKDNFSVWVGFAFERFCVKNAMYLAQLMGFFEETLLATPHFEKGDKGFQIDLLFQRTDNVITICEIKHHNAPITPKVIPEVESKLKQFKPLRGYSINKALISLYGPSRSLRESKYFQYYVTLKDIL